MAFHCARWALILFGFGFGCKILISVVQRNLWVKIFFFEREDNFKYDRFFLCSALIILPQWKDCEEHMILTVYT